MIDKVHSRALLKLSYFFFIFIILSGIFYADNLESNLSLLEKDYSFLKNQFENYLLDFPVIDFTLSDYNDSSQYLLVIEEYNSLPRLEILSINSSFEKLDVFIKGYFTDFNTPNLLKKETHLKVIYKDNVKEYIYVEYILLDFNVYYDFSKEIIRSSDSFKFWNDFLIIDKNLSYLTDDLSESFSVFKIHKEETIVQEKKDYTLFYFLILVFSLFVIYSYDYLKKNPLVVKKIKLRIRKIVLKIIKKTKQ